MNDLFESLSSRHKYAKKRLDEFRSKITTIKVLDNLPDLCIYVTGSFGRLEASKYSDLDLFFIDKGASKDKPISWINKTLLDAELIRAVEELGFPEFSNDGEYLSVHYLKDIKKTLGGRDDDFENHFTARLLLLLESRPLHNEDGYNYILQEIVDSYYRDFGDHETSFRPVFLINDILRFWRTLCLNYEYRRNRLGDDEEGQLKSHLLNLKLKFSRLLTCHSAIALLSMNSGGVEPNKLLEIIKLSPLERLDKIAEAEPKTKEHVEAMKIDYTWFLEKTGSEKSVVLSWIAKDDDRRDAFNKGRQFATQMYNILCEVADGTDNMRFLVV